LYLSKVTVIASEYCTSESHVGMNELLELDAGDGGGIEQVEQRGNHEEGTPTV
jgi:hypothetical protein